MEEQLRKIDTFLSQQSCVFQIDILEYPTYWQQQFINSFFILTNLMEKQHSQIVRQLHSSNDKSLQSIAQGFLYCSLVKQDSFQKLIQYMIILRVQIWGLITKNFQVLLHDHLDSIKPQYRINFAKIFSLLLSYSAPEPQLCRLLIKSINQYQKNTHKIKSGTKLLQYFCEFLKKSQKIKEQQFAKVLFHQLFLKCLRLNTHSIYSQVCEEIIDSLWDKNPEKCSVFLIDNISVIENQAEHLRSPLIKRIYSSLKTEAQTHVQQYRNREIIYAVLLPRRVETLMQYLLVSDNLKSSHLRIQLTWLQKQWALKQFSMIPLIIDIAVWVSLSYDNLHRRVYILDWTIRKAYSLNPNTYKIIKKSIFERWFRTNQRFEYYLVSLELLRHMIYNDPRIANEILTEILQQNSIYHDKIRFIFNFAHKNGCLKFQQINRSETITMGIKETLKNLMENSASTIANISDPRLSLYESPPPSKQEKSQSFDEINYDSPKIKVPEKITDETFILTVEQQYAISIGIDLTDLLDDPSMNNFNKFLKKASQVGVSSRREENNEQITDMICQQTAKVIYIMFNNEFQDFSNLLSKEKSVIFKILSFIVNQWHRVTHKLQIAKHIIKSLINLFPSAEPAIWKYYFSYFEFGGASNRSIKNWLVPSQKQQVVIPMLSQLSGKIDEPLRKNLSRYGFRII